MQRFFAGEVELDRCSGCGGIWCDWGELEQVTGRALEPELLEGHTDRRCAFCGITLRVAVLPGGVPVETCGACRGLYLDAGELSELGGTEPAPPRRLTEETRERAAEVLHGFDSFECVKCRGRFALRQGNALAGGLACPACTPGQHPAPGEPDLIDRLMQRAPKSWWWR
jgi:Zn-finger nucleic acid-binding protein